MMNDRFKFKGYHPVICEVMDISEIDYHKRIAYFTDGDGFDIDEVKLMQCTGLKDKNGKLIYEGDILKAIFTTPHGKIIEKVCEVEFSRCAFWVRDGFGAFYLDNENCVYEVIGNTYENKELLNE